MQEKYFVFEVFCGCHFLSNFVYFNKEVSGNLDKCQLNFDLNGLYQWLHDYTYQR